MRNEMTPVNTPDNQFHNGDPTQGIEGTIVTAEFLNEVQSSVISLQREVTAVLTQAGIKPDGKNDNQLAAALDSQYSGLIDIQIFKESGTYIPSNNTKKIIVEIVGGGGSGGGTSNLQVGSFCIGSGGGAGGYIKALIKDVVDEYSVIVGAQSGTSIFGDSLLVAKGGYSGDTFTGSPTSGSVLEEEVSSSIRGGDVTYSPLPMVLTALPGAAGSYGYSISAGLKFGGNGGSNPLGNGGVFPGLIPGLTSRAGSDGTGYGSGGSGSVLISTESLDSVSGGEGTPGIVIIYEYA